MVAAEDYTGKSPNVTPGYDTAPRYLAQHVAALEAAGYEVETYNIDAPPANGGTPNGVVHPQIKYPTNLGVLSHFDAVNYYTGDDFVPQDATDTNPRAHDATRDGADRLAARWRGWAHHVMLELRDYANEGGKLVVDGRNVHQPFTVHRARACRRPARDTWTPDKLFGFYYPDEQRAATTTCRARRGALARHRPTTRGRTTSASSAASRRQRRRPARSSTTRAGRRPKAGSLFDGMAPFTRRRGGRQRPQPDRRRHAAAAGQVARCGCATGRRRRANEPLRQETVEADYATTPAQNDHGRRDHLDA